MKTKTIILFILILASVLSNACGSTIRNVEVTRIVPQTVVATQLSTQNVERTVTAPPLFSNTPTSSAISTTTPSRVPFITRTVSVNPLVITPGILIADNNKRPDVENFISTQTIKDYLIMNYGIGVHGGKEFCAYQPLGMENDGKVVKLYLWIGCIEYYLNENGQIKQGTGSIIPVVLFVEWRHSQYRIVDTKDAGLGYMDLKNNFPSPIQKLVLIRDNPDAFNKATEKLISELDQEAKDFFGR